jgi:hypothetical protein
VAFELLGIDNENEFYPAAFLTDALEEELKTALTRWREAAAGATETPDARLSSVRTGYLGALDRVRSASSAGEAVGIWRRAAGDLVSALGYTVNREAMPTHDGLLVPVIARCANRDGRDQVWVIEAPMPAKDEGASDPLTQMFASEQFEDADRPQALLDLPIETVLTDAIFGMDAPPRYVIVAGLNQLVLIDRAKWARRSVLRFELLEIFKRAERTTLDAMACLLSREARAPETGVPLADRLEEEAQRHANAVTTSLKRTVRDAIEMLGNEVLSVTGGKYPTGKRKGVWIESQDLTIECLRYMYRLLFLFYAEANPRLGIIPLNDEIYRKGYSLEALRGLETRKLRTQEEKEGTFLWESLQRLLGLMYEGLDRAQIGGEKMFSLPRVRVSLLDPESTPILSNVKLRNEAMQRIIRSLSLKQDRAGTGRISYAQLGIGQLGAVYETLISFTGFVAKTDMIELIPPKGSKAAAEEGDEDDASAETDEANDEGEEPAEQAPEVVRTDKVDPLAPSYFVARERASEFSRDEIVYDGPQPRIYKKGSFVYRLAGRDRQKSASYYTPEPLARLLVKHALLERCKDMPADEVLELKILEPAMGSAAFLVETTNQLADIYLERKQDEIKRRIPQDQYYEERQKVRAYIADRNCFGIDQNPIAVELGQISLWLNGLHSSEFSPWFGDQLHAGNSLIGARRASYDARLLKSQVAANLWLKQIPMEIGWRGKRDPNHVWQFLLPAADMARFDTDKSIAEFAGHAQESIKAWRKGGFFAPLQGHEIKLLLSLSEAIDQLFDAVADDLKAARSAANDEITIWPDRVMPGVSNVDFHAKLARLRVLQGEEHVSNSLPYQRLKTVMDAWCALWLWPLDQAHLLPSRHEYLFGLQAILKGGITHSGGLAIESETEFAAPQSDLIQRLEQADRLAKDLPSHAKQSALFRQTNIDALVATSPWLTAAREVAARERFAHFDLIFSDVLRERGGFDLVVGNPPWSKPSWNEGDIVGDIDPAFVIRKLSAPQMRETRQSALSNPIDLSKFLAMYSSAKGSMAVTGSAQMNPIAGGGQNNLYRCFVDLAFRLTAPKGYSALIHEDGHLAEARGGSFRSSWYRRITKHFNFSNQLTAHNFAEVLHTKFFSLNIYSGSEHETEFDQFTNAFLASQIEESYASDGAGEVPGIKCNGSWDTRGHKHRLARVDKSYLDLAQTSGEGIDYSPPLYQFISAGSLAVFALLTKQGSLRSRSIDFQNDSMFHESGSQDAGLIEKKTGWPNGVERAVISSPTIFVSNPLYKTPRRNCRVPQDYDPIDLVGASGEFLPRTNYQLADSVNLRDAHKVALDWDPTKAYVDQYRIACRRRVDLGTERSLAAAIIPPLMSHIDSVESIAFSSALDLLNANALWGSVTHDFLIKSLKLADTRGSLLAGLPWIDVGSTAQHRGLRLCCLTEAYAGLWNDLSVNLNPWPWSSDDHRLIQLGAVEGPVRWDRTAGLRTEFSRRMALIEIDVLAAQSLGLTIDQLIEVYRVYFPILQENEAGTWYDQSGRIVWSCSKGLPGVGYLLDGKSPGRKAWEKIASEAPNVLTCEAIDDARPGGPRKITRRFVGPFTRHDRVADYRRAWVHFERLRSEGAAA